MARPIQDYLLNRATHLLDVSSDGLRCLLSSNRFETDNGTRKFELCEIAVDGGELLQLTELRDLSNVTGLYVPGTYDVLVSYDFKGNEQHQICRLRRPRTDTSPPVPRRPATATELEPVLVNAERKHVFGAISRDGRLFPYRVNNLHGRQHRIAIHDLASVDATSDPIIYDGDRMASVLALSPNSRYLLFSLIGDEPNSDSLHLADLHASVATVIDIMTEPGTRNVGCTWLDNERFYFSSTARGHNMLSVARFDLTTMTWEFVSKLEDCGFDALPLVSRDGSVLAVCLNDNGSTRCRLFDAHTLDDLREVPFPGRGLASICDGSLLSNGGVVYGFGAARFANQVFHYRRDLSPATLVLVSNPTVVPAYEMVDATEHRAEPWTKPPAQIHYLLFGPNRGTQSTHAVVIVHGGPESQSVQTWNPLAQYLVGKGYRVCLPNVRGSSGYGARYAGLDDKLLRLDAVEDLAVIHAELVQQGCDPDCISLMGDSYGGYMVYQGLSRQPKLWNAGVVRFGISNLRALLEDMPPHRRKYRAREYGDPDVPEHLAFLEGDGSPNLNKIVAPVLILHGLNDRRVPVRQAEAVWANLTARGVPCELVINDSSGHGMKTLSTLLEWYARVAQFLDRVSGGPSSASVGSEYRGPTPLSHRQGLPATKAGGVPIPAELYISEEAVDLGM